MHSFPLGPGGQRTAMFVHRHSCWLLLDVGLHQGLWEAESQNRRAFALFTIVVLNGQKITDRSCHVLPLSLANKGTRRQFESWTKETRNQNSFWRISHSNSPLESLTTLATLFILLLCSIVWSELEFDSSTFPYIHWHVLTLHYCLVRH